MKLFNREATITAKTPPKVARALIESWQAEQELALFDTIAMQVRDAQNNGLETRRIGRALSQLGAALERIGGASEPNGSGKP